MPLTAATLLGCDRGHRRRSGVRIYEISTTVPTSHRRNLHAPRRAIARPCIVDLARGVADQRVHNLDARRRRRGDAMTHWPQCRQRTAAVFGSMAGHGGISVGGIHAVDLKNRLWTHARRLEQA